MLAWRATTYREGVLLDQDEIRMQHYSPLHPQVVDAVRLLLDDRRNNVHMFKQLSFEWWLKQQKVPLVRGNAHFVATGAIYSEPDLLSILLIRTAQGLIHALQAKKREERER